MPLALAALLALCAVPLSPAWGQGALAPSGAPAPNMKTLFEVQPRTAITNRNSLVAISQPGSYYLTGSLTVSAGDAIDINANNVTLDLNGFTLSSTATPPSGTAVSLSHSLTNLTIVNGFVYGAITNNGAMLYGGGGFSQGIYASAPIWNARVVGIQVHGCGLRGIYLGTGTTTLVKGCHVTDVPWDGIAADLVLGSSASTGGGGNAAAIAAGTAIDCRGASYAGSGVQATHIAANCFGTSSTAAGIDTAIASNCRGDSVNQVGVRGQIVKNCFGTSQKTSGVTTSLGSNSQGNTTASGSSGFYATYLATGCYGYAPSGTGISAFLTLVSCAGTSTSASHKYNMP